MKINQKNTIENDNVGVDITVDVLGTADLTAEQELELLHNYNKMIEFNKISFKGNMRINNNLPVVTDDPIDGTNVVEVVINDIINEQIIVDENLNKIEDTLVEDEDSNIHEIIVDENAEQERLDLA